VPQPPATVPEQKEAQPASSAADVAAPIDAPVEVSPATPTPDVASPAPADAAKAPAPKPDASAKPVKTDKKAQKETKKEKGKKSKKAKPKHEPVHLKDIPRLVFPEHVGDLFTLGILLVFAIGATLFYFLAWLPTHDVASQDVSGNIQRFSETELQEIIDILEAREEASRAPVIPPERDPFN
jgi:hypothetical protein